MITGRLGISPSLDRQIETQNTGKKGKPFEQEFGAQLKKSKLNNADVRQNNVSVKKNEVRPERNGSRGDPPKESMKESKIGAKVESVKDSAVGAKVDSKSDVAVDAKMDSKVDSQSESSIDPKMDSKAEKKAEKNTLEFFPKPASPNKALNEREKVILKFMDSMESELGVPPEEITEAMTKIPSEELLKSPEETAHQLISQLDLSEEDKLRAESLYLSLLQNLKPLPPPTLVAQELNPSSGFFSKASSLESSKSEIVTPKDRKVLLNKSLDKMNQKFFVNPRAEIQAQALAKESFEVPSQDLKALQQTEQDLGFNEAEFAQKLAALGIAAQGLKESSGAIAKYQDMSDGAQTASLNPGMSSFAQNISKKGFTDDFANEDSQGSAFSDSQEAQMKSTKDSEFSKVMQPGGMPSEPKSFFAQGTIAGGASASHAIAGSAKEQNLQEIMSQAKYMIKKGGGEANVKLYPEGLGELNLKVKVMDGKVNIEMSAETNEAKKLLESSLSDLKSHLTHNKLGVDSIKVDIGNQSSLDSQNQNREFRFDQNKEQARQFLSDFRDSNAFGRSAYNEMPDLKAYNSQSKKKPEPLQPENTNSKARESRYLGSGRGSGLNLVA